MNIIKAIVIKTNVTFSTDYWGLYATAGNSEFRFSEKQLSGVTNAYHPEFITKNGIPDIVKTCDLLESGGVVQSTDITIRIKNTNQFDKFLESNEISLLKSTVEFYTYVGTDADSDSVIGRCDGVRTIESIEYTETELILKVKMSLAKQRNKRLSATLDLANYPYVPESNADKLIPVLFGSSDPINGRYFKILQSTAQNEVLRVIDTVLYDVDKTYNPYSYKFPAISDSLNAITARIQMGYAIDANDLITDAEANHPDWFDGLFLFCTDGPADIQNTAREISDYMLFGEIMPDTRFWIEVVLRDYLPAFPLGNSTFNATDQTYFELHRVDIKYALSNYLISGFYDSVTEENQTVNPDIYGNLGTSIEKLMTSGFDISIVNNTVDLNPRIFNNSELTKLLNYDCYPASRIDKMERHDFDAINHNGYNVTYPDLTTPVIGLNAPTVTGITVDNVVVTGSYLKAIDRKQGSGNRWINEFNTINGAATYLEIGYKISFPQLPEDYKFTKCYLGLNLKTESTKAVNGSGVCDCRVYLQQPLTFASFTAGAIRTINIDNIPDFYYLTDPQTGNYNFFYETANLDGTQYNVRGHKLFEIDVSNIKDIENIGWVSVVVNLLSPDTNPYNIVSTFEDACFIFEREQDIGKEFYV